MDKFKRKKDDGSVLNRVLRLKTKVHRAVTGDSNDAEHEALLEVDDALAKLASDVRRMEQALGLNLEVLQPGGKQLVRERH